jgi:hypothetical protein
MHGGIKTRCVAPCGAISQVAAEMGASTHLLVKIAFADLGAGVGAGPAAERVLVHAVVARGGPKTNSCSCEGCA